MKRRVQSKPSKASLVARGISTKPRGNKKSLQANYSQKPLRSSNPGYALYSTDSDADQAGSVNRGLDRCAVLLTNILKSEKKDSKHTTPPATHDRLQKTGGRKVKRTAAEGLKPTRETRPVVVPTATAQDRGSRSSYQHATSSYKSTEEARTESAPPFNERLVSSTPVLSSDQRQKQEQLRQREAQLQLKINQLKEHYDLIQLQRSPEYQTQQKLRLQTSLLTHLDQDQPRVQAGKPGTHSYTAETQAVLDGATELQPGARKTARRSLDFSGSDPTGGVEKGPLAEPFECGAGDVPGKSALGGGLSEVPTGRSSSGLVPAYGPSDASDRGPLWRPASQGGGGASNKRASAHSAEETLVRSTPGPTAQHPGSASRLHSGRSYEHAIDDVTPPGTSHTGPGYELSALPVTPQRLHVTSRQSQRVQSGRQSPTVNGSTASRLEPARRASTGSAVPPSEEPAFARSAELCSPPLASRPRSASLQIRENSPASVENQVRVVQYLIGELKALLGNVGDLEVDRLLMEIDQASRLLPYLVIKQQQPEVPRQPEVERGTMDDVLGAQPLRRENADLRRRLRLANQKLKKQGDSAGSKAGNDKTDLVFELAACRSVNAVLQKQLTEEKDNKEKILQDNEQLAKTVLDLQDEKKKLLEILSSKDGEYLKSKASWKQEALRRDAEVERHAAKLEANQLSLEATRKEKRILEFTLKQKEAEIGRLKELTQGLQHSLARLLTDLQQPIGAGEVPEQAATLRDLEQLLTRQQERTHATGILSLSGASELKSAGSANALSEPTRTLPSNAASPFSLYPRQPRQSISSRPRKYLRFVEEPATRCMDESSDEDLEANVRMSDSLCRDTKLDSLERSAGALEMSSLSSGDEEDFTRGLASLDADIARIQRRLREAALRS